LLEALFFSVPYLNEKINKVSRQDDDNSHGVNETRGGRRQTAKDKIEFIPYLKEKINPTIFGRT